MCKNANKLAVSLVMQWLKSYLLKDEPDPEARADEVTKYLSSHQDRLSHGRPITLATLRGTNLKFGTLWIRRRIPVYVI